MKVAVFQVLLLALLLAAGNTFCAMNCSAQPCRDESSLPPCHQHHGTPSHSAGVCLQALPDANLATVVQAIPVLPVVSCPETEIQQTAWFSRPAIDHRIDRHPPFSLRI
ncbi:MAG TPA: hypothetical protein VGL72_05615 [Bryobacteraceae bacterium]|jgi:hypothetical protein